jgi:hypothetical protein
MRGTTWQVVALGVGLAMLPLILDVDVSGDETGETAMTLLSSFDPIIGLVFALACFGLLTVFFGSDGF